MVEICELNKEQKHFEREKSLLILTTGKRKCHTNH